MSVPKINIYISEGEKNIPYDITEQLVDFYRRGRYYFNKFDDESQKRLMYAILNDSNIRKMDNIADKITINQDELKKWFQEVEDLSPSLTDNIISLEKYYEQLKHKKIVLEDLEETKKKYINGNVSDSKSLDSAIMIHTNDDENYCYSDGFIRVNEDTKQDLLYNGIFLVNATREDNYNLNLFDITTILEDLENFILDNPKVEITDKILINIYNEMLDNSIQDYSIDESVIDEVVEPEELFNKLKPILFDMIKNKIFSVDDDFFIKKYKDDVEKILQDFNNKQTIKIFWRNENDFILIPDNFKKEDGLQHIEDKITKQEKDINDFENSGYNPILEELRKEHSIDSALRF
jgi:hypothetical protein